MLWVQSIPVFVQKLFPGLIWQLPAKDENVVYLTFDDGPHPEISLWVAQELEKYQMKASFFCVGDNLRKHPETFQKLQEMGHTFGNHTMHHIKGWKVSTSEYIKDVEACRTYLETNLFRPPYGRISKKQIQALGKQYRLIMWSLLSCDFDRRLNPEAALKGLIKKTKNGSIVVFHDSEKAEKNLKAILPPYLKFLNAQGYICKTL